MKKKITIPKKLPKKFIEVYDPIFGRKINVLLNYTHDEYLQWCSRNNIKDISDANVNNFAAFCTVIEDKNGQNEILIWIRQFNWAIKCQGTLIHEITHAVVRVFENNNIPFNSDTQEFFAHMIGRVYEDIAEKLIVKVSK